MLRAGTRVIDPKQRHPLHPILEDALTLPTDEREHRDVESEATATRGSPAAEAETHESPTGERPAAIDTFRSPAESAPEPPDSFPTMTRFARRRLLGSGGFGVVYEAYDHDQNAVVALKTLRRADAAHVSYLKREFRSLADTVHPNLVELYELLSDGVQWFFTMALVEGIHFDQYVRRHPHALREALKQLADGVLALHRAGKLHQDLKPSNVLVTSEGRVVILDFGLVADVGLGSRATPIAGTPAYMAPERLRNTAPCTASDCYSVGVMLFHALTGHLPQANESLAKLDAVPEDLARLCHELLDVDPAARPSASEIIRRLSRESSLPFPAPATMPFVGRTAEMNVLRNAIETAAAGSCVVVFMDGASGQGKTALVHRFLDEIRASRDLWILSGRCHPQELVPYNALDEVVEQMAEILPRVDDVDTAVAAQLFPVLNPIADRPHVFTQERRHAAAVALRSLVGRLATGKTLVVHVDDLHWASADSLWLLSELLRAPGIARSMWIISSRQPVHIPGVESPVRLELLALTMDGAIELAQHLLPQDLPDRSARAVAIAREAGGNPFLISEFALNTERDATGSLEAILDARVSRLSVEARHLLEVVAIAGDPVESSVAWRAARQDGVRQAAILALRANRFVQINAHGELELYHDRMRHAIATRISPASAAERHLHLAMELERSRRGSSESLTVHYLEGGDRDKAFHHAIAAAIQASRALAFESAVRFYRIALSLRPGAAGLRASLADALSNAGRGAEAAAQYLDCVPGEAAFRQLHYRRRAATEFLISGHMQRGIETLQEVLSAIGVRLPRSAVSALPSLLLLRARVWLRGLEPRVRVSTDDRTERMDALWTAAQGLAMVDSLRAASFHTRHLLLALDSDDPPRAAKALAIEAGYHAMFGAKARSRSARAFSLATRLAERSGDPHAVGLTHVVAGMMAFLQGRWAVAHETLAGAEALLRERCVGVAWELGTARLVGCVSMFFLGEIAALRSRLPVLLDNAQARGNVYESTDLQIRIAHAIHLAGNAPATAEDQVREAISRWPTDSFYLQHWWALIVHLEIALYKGDAARAWQLVNAHWKALRRSLLLNLQYVRVESRYHRALAALALASQDARRRKSLQRIALEDARRIERERLPWGEPLVRLIRAAVDPDAAIAHLSAAEATAKQADMRLFAAAARRRRGEVIGGSEGGTLIAEADAVMRAQAIMFPDRMTAILSP